MFPTIRLNFTSLFHHLAHSVQQWPTISGWWWRLRTRDHILVHGGWPAMETLLPLRPVHPQYAMSWKHSSHSLQVKPSVNNRRRVAACSEAKAKLNPVWSNKLNNTDEDNNQFCFLFCSLNSETCFVWDILQFSSSDPSSQSSVPSHSGFTLLRHLLFLHLYEVSVQGTADPEKRKEQLLNCRSINQTQDELLQCGGNTTQHPQVQKTLYTGRWICSGPCVFKTFICSLSEIFWFHF